MSLWHHAFVAAALLVVAPLSSSPSQTAPDPSGHWEGSIDTPERQVDIAIDLAKKGAGEFVATFTGTDVTGLPLSNVVVNGASVGFLLKANSGGTFAGTLSPDGQSLSGTFTLTGGPFTAPFKLTRTGAARIETVKSAAITNELEGTWNGSLDVNGSQLRVVVRLANRPDGTSTGSVAVLEQGGLEIPITTITQTASDVRLDVSIVGGIYSGVLNADGTELSGTWTQRGLSAPLDLKRAAEK